MSTTARWFQWADRFKWTSKVCHWKSWKRKSIATISYLVCLFQRYFEISNLSFQHIFSFNRLECRFWLGDQYKFYELDLVEMKCWCTAWVSNKTKVVHDIFCIYFHPQSFITAEIWAHITLLIIKLKLNAFVCVGLILQARMFRFWLKKLLLTLGLFVTWGLLR